jgi:hypothetical protein
MYDARIFLKSLEQAKKVLNNNQANFKGEYFIHDSIYSLKNSDTGIDKTFLRLRSLPMNIWNEKPFIVSIKMTEVKEVGKQSIIPIKKQFDTEDEAKEFIDKNYSDQFSFLYKFSRRGWQYDLGEDQVDLEDIEGLYSIEFKSWTEEGLKKLLTLFGIDFKEVIQAPSVVEIKKILGR